ncbi:MAG: sensor histidine kinase, partial [Bacteroidales bacterium]
ALVFSAYLPVSNIITNPQNWAHSDLKRILQSWEITFTFLLVCWFVNSYITVFFDKLSTRHKPIKRVFAVVLCNSVLLLLFIVFGVHIFSESHQFALLGTKNNFYLSIVLKGFVGIVMIYVIQYALNSNARAQSISLQNQMLKTENIRVQFEILRQQVNPHFLFNSLSTLRSMIRLNSKNSEDFVIKLSEVYRQLLLKREKELVTLKEELDFIGDYSYMLFARFQNMLIIETSVPDDILNLRLPTFSLQLLLENCIKHNIVSQESPLRIKIFNTSSNFIIVENNLQPKISESVKSGYGLQNLVQRYSLLGYPDAVSVFSDENVFRVKVRLLEE